MSILFSLLILGATFFFSSRALTERLFEGLHSIVKGFKSSGHAVQNVTFFLLCFISNNCVSVFGCCGLSFDF
ncbi:uncharacterized protein BYT42DRAFT_11482 [Radiomyces spectabilis]|uniref:uncharacterized protein n=1 Tax=Radiomyces spectabilis TaxID=64574 RepID=UPI00221EB53B|nr:uncharacterized protein BYT42DRAFT_11482 [Radiomyces spectabilis]KAI8393555.1 hypothetical protein BYT42DRAFT_11482 [Radiomyces spectabilis]